MKTHLWAAAAWLAGLVSAVPAQAAWPSDQPIEVFVGFAAGGTTDVMIRTLAPYIAKQLGDGEQNDATENEQSDGERNDDATDQGPDANPNEPGHQDADESGETE